MFGLIDGNNFFVSCERIFRPDLLGKPVVVLSNNDGNIIARSNESKALGIAMGVPYFRVKTLLEHHKGIVFSSNFQLYRDISHRMMNMIESFVPGIEVYSIDEAFMDFKGYIDPLGQSHKIRQSILKSVGIPSSIGIGPTKTLAKVANRIAKQHPSFQHVCMLDSVDDINEALQSLDVSDIWGIGPKLTQHLRMSGIMTAYDLKCTAPSWARKRFSIVEERIVHELNGVSCLSFANIPDSPKSIQMTRSFGKNLQDIDDLQRVLCTYACRLGQKLRRYHLKTCTVLIYIKTNVFSV